MHVFAGAIEGVCMFCKQFHKQVFDEAKVFVRQTSVQCTVCLDWWEEEEQQFMAPFKGVIATSANVLL